MKAIVLKFRIKFLNFNALICRLVFIIKKISASKVILDFNGYSDFILHYIIFAKNPLLNIQLYYSFTECVVVKDSATEILLTERNSFLLGFQIKITCPESKVSQFPMVGDLLCVEITSENHHSFSIFAYVCDVSVSAEGDASLSKCKFMNLYLQKV